MLSYLKHKKKYEKVLFISSMGRSGSTLLSNLLNCQSGLREVFEPFCPERVKIAKPFIYPKYLRPDNSSEIYLKPAKKIISGLVNNDWTNQTNSMPSAKGLIIKDIRSNLFLRWINTHFPKVELCLLIRNPFSVASSWISANFGDGSGARESILAQEDLIQDYLQPFKEEYLSAEGAFLRLIFFWCIYYYVPLKQFSPDNITILFYENLVKNIDAELEVINSRLHLSFNPSCVNEILKTPSHTTRKDRDLRSLGNIGLWSEGIETSIIDKSLEIMNLFDMDTFYGQNGMPNRTAVLKFLNRTNNL